jgi:superfamily II DNA or RNA helicase
VEESVPASQQLQTRVLSRGTDLNDYAIYRAGLEWDLTDPIVINSEEDFKSKPRWRDRLKPFMHQVTNLMTFCRRLPVTLLADDVGLGKTISAGLIMSELAARGRLAKTLVVCPKILGRQWKEELETKFDIPAVVATGKALLKADPGETGAVITTYNSARIYLESLPEDRFDMLVLDEAHKLRNLYGVPDTPQVATKFRKALEARRFRFVLMLTATPIQNRLWDLYSLVDLLTVARGHENPFGTEGMFARKFIDDDKTKARQLKPAAREQFRSIVYNYMSRTRRGDAKLYFPDRKVQMHRVAPTDAELRLIAVVAKSIKGMNKLAQISILQALVSSPDALNAQLKNMARNGTVAAEFAAAVQRIVDTKPRSAKLEGLATLIAQLKKQNKDRWRLVIFTTRRETQTTIEDFLRGEGLKVGLINGESGQRNQETIKRFWKEPPDINVIVSTEAGSEGVNLQVANVLVNYDLPWNPMIVEQRIGRIQRLASEHKNVSIFNVMLTGTFEEYIVGRLMEKLQMAAHAIGDIESLLQGAGTGDDEDSGKSFEERILDLVLDALQGKDVAEATRLTAESIDAAQTELEREEKNINELLGSSDGKEYVGPRAPVLPAPERSMDVRTFTLAALPFLGAKVTPREDGMYLVEEKSAHEIVTFEPRPEAQVRASFYTSESPPFQRLVKRVIASGLHDVQDSDADAVRRAEELTSTWAKQFDARVISVPIAEVRRSFVGTALLKVRANVAHDSYERIVACACDPAHHVRNGDAADASLLKTTITDPATLGIDTARLCEIAERDPALVEFSRFYLERRDHETQAAGADERKRQKLMDDFTPRVEMTLVGLQGTLSRELTLEPTYEIDGTHRYQSRLTIRPGEGTLLTAPSTDLCTKTGRMVPVDCLGQCAVTGSTATRHLLTASQISGRLALPEFTARCSLSGKVALIDELETSEMSGALVDSSLLKTCAVSRKRGEPSYFGVCTFTKSAVLNEELGASDISGKSFRRDQSATSMASKRMGHRREFIECHETRQLIALDEAETCELTGKQVRKGILVACAETAKRVLPSELGRCAATGQQVLKSLLATSSVSGETLLKRAGIQSRHHRLCLPSEATECFWSGRLTHPDDLRTCELTGLLVHIEYTKDGEPRLRPLAEMLDGTRRTADQKPLWNEVAEKMSGALSGRTCRIEAATLSPTGRHLATCSEVKSMLGLRVRHVAGIYSLAERSIAGHIPEGKRTAAIWQRTS